MAENFLTKFYTPIIHSDLR